MELNKKLFCAAAFAMLCSSIFALEVPALSGYVNDNANIISKNDESEITEYLEALENTTGIQIAVLTIPTLDGEDLAGYSLKVCENWKLGQKDKDNGALLLVALAEHQVRIETGYGLEDKLTDTKCGLIIRNVIIPEFKNGDYSKGILKGVQNMGGIASDNAELVSKSVSEESEASDSVGALFCIIIWIIFVFIVIASRSTASRRGRSIRRFYSTPTMLNMKNSNSNSYHGGFGGSSFGGGGFGGGSSFHGGGGSFGGGGASGHW